MDADKITRVLQRMGRTNIKRSAGSPFIYTNCPMAPYSDGHSKNFDSNPSFWVNMSNPSFCGCWSCDFDSKPLVYILKELARKSDKYKEAYKLALEYDARYLNRKTTEGFGQGFRANRMVYTGYDKKFRSDMDCIPWDWLASKGVHEAGVESFRIGLDVGSGSVVLPSIDRDGTVVGAQARSIYQGSEKNNKYISILKFSSSNYFFGEHLLDEENNAVVIFEGPFDAVHAWEEGVENTLAVYGKALREEQVLKLKKWEVQYCYLLLDPDAAGQAGIQESKKLIDRLYPELVVYSPELPCDPKNMSAKQFRQVLEQENAKWRKKASRESLEKTIRNRVSASKGRKNRK